MNIRTILLLGQKTWRGYTRDNCSQMAAAIAYHILFSIVPLTMFIVAVLGLLLGSDEVQQRITDAVSDQFDLSTLDVSLELSSDGRARIESTYGAQALADVEDELASMNSDDARAQELTANANTLDDGGAITVDGYELTDDDVAIHFDNIVLDTVRSVVSASGAISVVSLLLLGYAASGLFGVVRRSLDFVWNMPRHLPVVTGKLVDVAWLFTVVFMFVLMLALLFSLSIASTVLFRIIGNLGSGDTVWLQGLIGTLGGIFVPMLFSFVLFLLLYLYGPHVRNSLSNVWLGALLAAVGFEVLKAGYSIYITNFAHFDLVYGALGGVLLFLLFVYLGAQVFLIGAELAAEYPGVMSGEYAVPVSPAAAHTTLRQKVRSMIRSLFVSSRPP